MGNTPIDISRPSNFGLGHPLSEELALGDEARVRPRPSSEEGEGPGDSFAAATERFAGSGAPRSLLIRDAEELGSRLPAEARGVGFLGFTADLDARAEALAFFRGFQVFREPGSLESQLLSSSELDAETLAEALRHFEALCGENSPGSTSGVPAFEPATILRILARSVAAQNPDLPDAVQRLDNERLLCRVFSALLRAEGRSQDRDALIAAWLQWREELERYPVAAEVLIQDYAAMAEIVDAQELPELRLLLPDAVQAQVEAWRHPAAGTDPRAAIQGRQRAFALLQGTWETLGEPGRQLFLDLVEDLDRDALALERGALAGEPAVRLQALGEAAALYRQLSAHPEAGEHYRARLRATLESLLAIARGEGLDPGLRLQVALQVAREFATEGDGARAEAIRAEWSARAERALRSGGLSRASIVDRYADLREALLIYRELGPEASRVEAGEALRRLLRGVLDTASRRENPELRREAAAFALEGYLELGDWEEAEILWRGLRAGLPRPTAACREGEAAAEMDVDACAVWLRRLGGYAQRLAVARADGSESAPDFSLFREALADLAALGARSGRGTMALYGRFMLAVLDRDPAAESIYERLRDEGSLPVSGFELPIHDILLAASGGEAPPTEPVPDEYQRMAGEIWERHRPFLAVERSAATLSFLAQMIEGNCQQRLAAAEEEGESRLPILEEREAMRRSLALVQQALVTGRAADTAAAIELLPDLLGDEDAARDFYRGLGGAFAYESLDGVEHGNSDLVRRLIDVERSADSELRAQRYLSLAREMVVADSLNRRCDGLIAALLQAAEDGGARGRAPRPLMEILGNLSRQSRDLGDFSELYNRIAGNETLQEQIQAFRDVTPYIQTMNQVVDSVFSVEGGAILLASIFTGGLAAELAGAALLARLGAAAYVVADGAVAMTWTARAAVGATRIAAAWAARSATELGGIAVYRAAMGRRQMDFEEMRLRLITSLFCSVGDEFATHFTRAFLSRTLRPVFGETARGMARTHAATEVAEFFASGLGEMWGEEVGARVAGAASDTRPFLVRYFEETLHGSFFVAGTRAGAPVTEAVLARIRPEEPVLALTDPWTDVPTRPQWDFGRITGLGDGGGTGAVTALLAAGAGAATLLGADTAHAAFEAAVQDGSSRSTVMGLGFATAGVFAWFVNRIRGWWSRDASESPGARSSSPYRDPAEPSEVFRPSSLASNLSRRLARMRNRWGNRELSYDTRLEAIEAFSRDIQRVPPDQTEYLAEQAVYLRENFDGTGTHELPRGIYAWFDFLFPASDSMVGAGYAASVLPRRALELYQWLLGRLPPGHPEIYRGAEFLLDQPGGHRDLRFLRRLMRRGFRSSDHEASEFGRMLLEISSDPRESSSAREEALALHRFLQRLNLPETEEVAAPRIRVEVEGATPELLESREGTAEAGGEVLPDQSTRRRGRGDGGNFAALLAASAGIATLLGAGVARAQDSLHSQGGGALDAASWMAFGGVFAAGLAYLYASWRRSNGRLHLERIAALPDSARSEQERRELGEWLRREARENPEAFGAEALRALRNHIRADSLQALDVYLALLETDHPVARQLLTAEDVRRCETMILAQARGAEGVRRLLDAALRARVSVRLIEVVAQRIDHPFVGQQIVAGITAGQLRSSIILLKALEVASPNRIETFEEVFNVLRRAARRNYHARRFLERVLERPDLALFHDQARITEEERPGGDRNGAALAWLTASAGGAAWLNAGTAHAETGMAEEAISGSRDLLQGLTPPHPALPPELAEFLHQHHDQILGAALILGLTYTSRVLYHALTSERRARRLLEEVQNSSAEDSSYRSSSRWEGSSRRSHAALVALREMAFREDANYGTRGDALLAYRLALREAADDPALFLEEAAVLREALPSLLGPSYRLSSPGIWRQAMQYFFNPTHSYLPYNFLLLGVYGELLGRLPPGHPELTLARDKLYQLNFSRRDLLGMRSLILHSERRANEAPVPPESVPTETARIRVEIDAAEETADSEALEIDIEVDEDDDEVRRSGRGG